MQRVIDRDSEDYAPDSEDYYRNRGFEKGYEAEREKAPAEYGQGYPEHIAQTAELEIEQREDEKQGDCHGGDAVTLYRLRVLDGYHRPSREADFHAAELHLGFLRRALKHPQQPGVPPALASAIG